MDLLSTALSESGLGDFFSEGLEPKGESGLHLSRVFVQMNTQSLPMDFVKFVVCHSGRWHGHRVHLHLLSKSGFWGKVTDLSVCQNTITKGQPLTLRNPILPPSHKQKPRVAGHRELRNSHGPGEKRDSILPKSHRKSGRFQMELTIGYTTRVSVPPPPPFPS